MSVRIELGDCRETLVRLAAEGLKAQCCVTSPPYFGLRDYGMDGQIGLEPTPEAYVAKMVDVFRAVRDVLADDGVVWLNLGDSYAGSGPSGASYQSATTKARESKSIDGAFRISKTLGERGLTYSEKKPVPPAGLKSKDLIGIPWRVAFALQADGWWLRQDVIWAKPNPMPESVTDRCTKSHEYLFLLAKRERYFFDSGAIAEPLARPDEGVRKTPAVFGGSDKWREGKKQSRLHSGNKYLGTTNGTRNKRSVWTITTHPYKGAHFATFPMELARLCVLSGSRVGDTVLDPFMGSGTVAAVATELNRNALGCELNPKYIKLAERRASRVQRVMTWTASA